MNIFSKESLPDQASFFICDDVRIEKTGVPILISVYFGDELNVSLLGKALPEGGGLIGSVPSLAILGVFKGGSGSYETSRELYAPDGALIEKKEMPPLVFDGKVSVTAEKFLPFTLRGFGEYLYRLTVGGREYDYRFSVFNVSSAEQR